MNKVSWSSELEAQKLSSGVIDYANRASEVARRSAETKALDRLRQRLSDKTFYGYDDSSSNRFTTGLRHYRCVAESFQDCLKLTEALLVRYCGELGWQEVKEGLALLQAEATQPTEESFFIFSAHRHWHCFFCISGQTLYEAVIKDLQAKKQEQGRNQTARCRCDNYDSL